MPKKSVSNLLGSTAFWTASVRALESRRPDGLFNDPWAADLAGKPGAAWIAQRSEASVLPIVLRTRYFDDFSLRVSGEDGIRQVVILGAGLDTRAYRLNWPVGTICFEIDQPVILGHKNQVLSLVGAKPQCRRLTIGADLTGPWQTQLMAAGFHADYPSAWILEGFLFYLPQESLTHLIDQVGLLSAPGSWLGFDIINPVTLTHPLTCAWVEMQAASGAPWIGTMEDPAAFLGQRGWQANLSQAGASDANHGRWPYPIIPVDMPNMPHNWYVTARKEQ